MNTGKFFRRAAWPRLPWRTGPAGRWLSAVLDWHLQRRQAPDAETTRWHESLLELDARTLRDIGAPPALQASAIRRRQSQHDRLDDLRAGGAAGDWQRW